LQIKPFLDSIKDLSENTRLAYHQTLRQLNSQVKGKEPSQKDILKFLNRFQPSSLQRHKAAIKAYLEFKGETWPFTTQEFSRIGRKVPQYVSPDVVEKIIETADNEGDRMFIYTLFTLGSTISEIIGIEIKDITASGVRVTVKGGITRLKPVTKDFHKTIVKYARNKDGKIFPKSYSYYYGHLRKLAKESGFEEVTPIMIRNARAVDLLNKGMALPLVQQFFGDASMNIIAIYNDITGDRFTRDELIDELEKAERCGVDI